MKYKIKEYQNERKYKFWPTSTTLNPAQSALALHLNHSISNKSRTALVHSLQANQIKT